ncbi:unnamed protein product [Parascedosporium putredinis]|uniref:Uncharacterized protein n=1 Tax=Parascedosporium putredinis TaxID=1442378 RepID=A0A9P1M6U7_9PEZI|nr:unnamed protein product [Parascedosporium putredinis]CAI7990365.1 unnamed protein product [Parascedosporium putredinis]
MDNADVTEILDSTTREPENEVARVVAGRSRLRPVSGTSNVQVGKDLFADKVTSIILQKGKAVYFGWYRQYFSWLYPIEITENWMTAVKTRCAQHHDEHDNILRSDNSTRIH